MAEPQIWQVEGRPPMSGERCGRCGGNLLQDSYGDISCIHCGWVYIEPVPRALLERYKGRGSDHSKRGRDPIPRDPDGRYP